MRSLRRISTLAIFLIPLALLGWLSIVMIRRYYRTAEQDLRPVLEAEATNALRHEVRVGSVTLAGGHAYVDNVRIAEGKTLTERGAIVTARRVVVDFDLRTILLTRTIPDPLLGNGTVFDAVAHVRRDAAGHWNFEELFHKRPGPQQPAPVGRLTVVNGLIDYADLALPRNPKRPTAPFAARLAQVGGDLLFSRDRTVNWDLTGVGAGGQLASAHILGSYEPAVSRIFMRVDADRLNLPIITRMLPPDVDITTGIASGQLTVVRTPQTIARGGLSVDIQADVRISGGTIVTSRLAEPVRDIAAQATIANQLATVRVDAGFAGSGLHAEGTVVGFHNPAVNGWASGNGVQAQRALTALRLRDRFAALKQLADLSATANLRANVSGPLNRLNVQASGPAAVSGTLPGGAVAPAQGVLQVAFGGSVENPEIVLGGTLPVVSYRGYAAHNLRLSAVYTPARAVADFQGTVGGGFVSGHAAIAPKGRQTTYEATARARGVNLALLPVRTHDKHPMAGIGDADIIGRGSVSQRLPVATAEVHVSGLKYDKVTAAVADARLRTAGDLVFIEPLTVRDPKGTAVARGTVNTRTRTLDLSVQGDRIDASRVLAALSTKAPEKPIAGLIYVRDARIAGTLDSPRVSGRVIGYGVQYDRYGLDYATAEFTATRDQVVLLDSALYRYPGSATIAGTIRDPLGEHPAMALSGALSRVEISDIADLAGSTMDVSGVASGPIRITGSFHEPEISMPTVTVSRPEIGDYDLRSLTGRIQYDPREDGGTWHIADFVATKLRTDPAVKELTTITGDAALTRDQSFRLTAHAVNVDVDLAEPYVSEYVTLAGTAQFSGIGITGRLENGEAKDLAGTLTASTTGLLINGLSFGDLHGQVPSQPATFHLTGRAVTSGDVMIGTPDSGIRLTAGPGGAPALRYDLDAKTIQASGALQGISYATIRQAIAKSPYIAEHPENPAAHYVNPTLNPIEGTLAAAFSVTGPTADPTADFSWTSQQARIAGQDIQVFEGRVVFNHDIVRLMGRGDRADATLEADQTVVTMHGSLEVDKRLTGDMEIVNLPLTLLDRWFPGQPVIKDLSGSAESISIAASGNPSNPSLTLSALMQDVIWTETEPLRTAAPGPAPPRPAAPADALRLVTRHDAKGNPVQVSTTGRVLHIQRVDVASATVNAPATPNKIVASDVRVTLIPPPRTAAAAAPAPATKVATTRSASAKKGTAKTANAATTPVVPAAAPVPAALKQFVIFGSGSVDFDWRNLDVLKDPYIDAQVRVPESDLNLLTTLSPTATLGEFETGSDVVGTVLADFRWRGHVNSPNITGQVAVNADHLRFANMATQIKDLKADLALEGAVMRVRQFTARTQVINPRTLAPVITSPAASPLAITGSIRFAQNGAATPFVQGETPQIVGPSLHITADKLVVHEAPLPGMRSGRLMTDNLSADLNVGGSLRKPIVVGKVGLDQADFRMPDTLAAPSEAAFVAVLPILDVRFDAGPKVRITSAQLTANIHTDPTNPVVLKGDVEKPDTITLGGNMIVDSGTLTFPTYRFTINRGGIVSLRYPTYTPAERGGALEASLGVNVDVTAVTRISAVSVAGVRKRYTITAEARGPINSGAPLQLGGAGATGNVFRGQGLQLTFRSDPSDLAYTSAGLQQTVVSLLGGQQAIEGLFSRSPDITGLLRSNLADALSNVLLPELLERLGISQIGGFEQLTVDVDALNTFTLQATRQLFGPIYATYYRRLSEQRSASDLTQFGWEFKLSYRLPATFLRSNLQLSYSIDDQRTNAYLLEGVFRF